MEIDGTGRFNLKMDSGRSLQIDPNKRPHLDYGYAMTSHSSQGQTANHVLIHVDTELAAKDLLNPNRVAYVSVSRGAFDAQLFTNVREKLPALSHDVSKQIAQALQINTEQAIAPPQEVSKTSQQEHDEGLGIGL